MRLSTPRLGETEFDLSVRYNIAPTNLAPVVLLENGKAVCREMRWGWTTKFDGLLTNARAETAKQKIFRDSWANQRCIIPADGFYEWVKGTPPQPYRIVRVTRNPFWFAGLCSKNEFTILTAPAMGFMRALHDRQPIIICESEIDWWLTEPPEPMRAGWDLISREVSNATLDAYAVTPRINHVGFESPDCINPIRPAQPDMFRSEIPDQKYRWRDLSDPPSEKGFVRFLIDDEKTADGQWDGDKWILSENQRKPLKWRPLEKIHSV